MLKMRSLRVELAGEVAYIKPVKGCPQGGALSPLLWTLVVDELLHNLNDNGLRTDGFADDLFALILGFDFSTMSDLAQQVCSIVENWCNNVGLKVNPDKVSLVVFSNKKKRNGYKDPILFGKQIKPSNEVKYLGVYLDQKLNWEKYLDNITSKAIGALFACRRMVGSKWGIKPKMMRWIYISVIRPAMAYAAAVWNRKC